MKNIVDYGIVIIDRDGEEFDYIREFGHLHQEYLDEYCNLKGYNTSNWIDLAKNMGEAVFYIFDKRTTVAALPNDVTDGQFENLKSIAPALDCLELFKIRKFENDYFVDSNLSGNDIGNQFLEKIQSVYDNEEG